MVPAWTACALGMLCKQDMVTAPLLVLAYDTLFVARDTPQASCRRNRATPVTVHPLVKRTKLDDRQNAGLVINNKQTRRLVGCGKHRIQYAQDSASGWLLSCEKPDHASASHARPGAPVRGWHIEG